MITEITLFLKKGLNVLKQNANFELKSRNSRGI